MNKLRLDLEDLAVESFDTTPAARREGGTVFGQQCTCYTQCTCPGCPTCDASCNGTCGGTCGATCDGTCYASCNGTCYASCDCNNSARWNTCGNTCGEYSCYYDGSTCLC